MADALAAMMQDLQIRHALLYATASVYKQVNREIALEMRDKFDERFRGPTRVHAYDAELQDHLRKLVERAAARGFLMAQAGI